MQSSLLLKYQIQDQAGGDRERLVLLIADCGGGEVLVNCFVECVYIRQKMQSK